jgi:hypothetical protein
MKGPLVLLLLIATGSLACGGDSVSETPQLPTVITQLDFRFEPANSTRLSFLDIRSGPQPEVYEMKIINAGSTDHTFTIDGLGIDEVVAPGSNVLVDIPADAGQVEFYCRFHEQRGMRGTFTVAQTPGAS